MKKQVIIDWSEDKNEILKKQRNVSFEMVAIMIENNIIIDEIKHSNKERYTNQKIYVLEIDGYVYLVPFVKSRKKIFLKTIIPSRKYTKLYLK